MTPESSAHAPTGTTGTAPAPETASLDALESMAQRALALWDLPAGAKVRLINVSENKTYLVEAPDGFRAILRVHRPNYHSRRAIECELLWAEDLSLNGGVGAPRAYLGRDGTRIQTAVLPGQSTKRHLVLFHFIQGDEPTPDHDLRPAFQALGAMAARTHLHAIGWPRPRQFERLRWDLDAVFGSTPTWGHWRDAPGVTPAIAARLSQTQDLICARLDAFGTAPERFGLIHADMRLANLLIGPEGPQLIDFDDCGLGWFLYDFAAAISFMEDHPQVGALKAAWVTGYRNIRALSDCDVAELDTFVMLRRLALLAWIGSHITAPEPQRFAPSFARVTDDLAEAYLAQMRTHP